MGLLMRSILAKTKPGSGLSVGAKTLRMPDSALSCSIWSEYRACRPSWLMFCTCFAQPQKNHRNRCKHMQTLSKPTKNTCWTVPSLIWQLQLKNSLFTSLVLWRRFTMHIWPSPFTYHGNLRATSNAIPSGIKALLRDSETDHCPWLTPYKYDPYFKGPPPWHGRRWAHASNPLRCGWLSTMLCSNNSLKDVFKSTYCVVKKGVLFFKPLTLRLFVH